VDAIRQAISRYESMDDEGVKAQQLRSILAEHGYDEDDA